MHSKRRYKISICSVMGDVCDGVTTQICVVLLIGSIKFLSSSGQTEVLQVPRSGW